MEGSEKTTNQNKTDTCCCGSPPYRDDYVTTALILSLAAVVFSWVFYATFLVGLIAVALQQMLWCKQRQTKAYILATSFCSYLACLLSLGTGIFVGIAFRTRSVLDRFPMQPDTDYVVDCQPFTLSHERGRAFSDRSNCSRRTYTVICVLAAILWGVSASYLMVFVKNGRYDRMVQKEEQDKDEEAVEESEEDTVPLPVVRSPAELAALEAAALPPEHPEKEAHEANV